MTTMTQRNEKDVINNNYTYYIVHRNNNFRIETNYPNVIDTMTRWSVGG